MIAAEIDRLCLLDLLRMERAFVRRALAGLTPEELDAPGTLGEWSAKGLLAHLSFWQERYLDVAACVASGETPELVPYNLSGSVPNGLSDAEVDVINAAVDRAAEARPLVEVLAEFEATQARVLAHALSVPEDRLNARGVASWLGDLTLLEVLAGNSYAHDHDHAVQVGQWRGALDPTMDKLRLLDLIRMEHDFLRRALAGLTPDEMAVPGVVGDWSVKDILAHITTWEQRFLRALADVARGEVPDWPEAGYSWDDLDALNARDFRANQDRPLAEVWVDFERSFAELLAKTISMPDAALLTPGYYGWTGEHALWRYLDANAGEHYREHAGHIRQWRNELTVGSQQKIAKTMPGAID